MANKIDSEVVPLLSCLAATREILRELRYHPAHSLRSNVMSSCILLFIVSGLIFSRGFPIGIMYYFCPGEAVISFYCNAIVAVLVLNAI
jgi:hypothetical protein